MDLNGRKPGRPPKYTNTSLMHIVVPSELKEYLREISVKTGKSMSELVVEALTNYYHEVKLEKVKLEKEKSAREILVEYSVKEIKWNLDYYKRLVKNIEEAIKSNGKLVFRSEDGSTVKADPLLYAENKVKEDLENLIKEILKTERIAKSRELSKCMKEALELKGRLKKAIELGKAKRRR